MKAIQKLKKFLTDLYRDNRIPNRDKFLILILIALIISPVDFIPDWFPLIGQLDDLMMISLVLDYFFAVLDHKVILTHYPWSLKSFTRLRLMSKPFQFFIPKQVKKKIWKYVPEPF